MLEAKSCREDETHKLIQHYHLISHFTLHHPGRDAATLSATPPTLHKPQTSAQNLDMSASTYFPNLCIIPAILAVE
eukprot:scaffold1480_cov106-Skeletonema_dohrnii-CCMP3373.AAC.8